MVIGGRSGDMKYILVGSALLLAAMASLAGQSSALAHPHTANGHIIANGQNHPKFEILSGVDFDGDGVIEGLSCESFGAAAGGDLGPAWFGLETAHHGPDAGDPGKGDGCYETTGSVAPGADDQNPAID
jgi:hypothetical protein